MFCSKCGKEIQGNVSFCPACGSKVGESPLSVSQPIKVMLDPAETMPEKRLLTVVNRSKDKAAQLVLF